MVALYLEVIYFYRAFEYLVLNLLDYYFSAVYATQLVSRAQVLCVYVIVFIDYVIRMLGRVDYFLIWLIRYFRALKA